MNPYDCRVALRMRNPFEVLDLALVLVRAWAGPLARLVLAVVVPAWLLADAALALTGEGELVALAAVVLGPALQAPFTHVGARMLFGPAPALGPTLRATLAQAGRVALLVALQLALLGLAACSALVLWVPAHLASLFVAETLLLEGVPVSRAGRRSALLASEVLGKALLGALISPALAVWTVLAVEALAQGIVGGVLQLGAPFGAATEGEVTPWILLGVLLAQPLLALYRLLLYVDARTTLEGWDLQIELKAAGEEA